MNGKILSRLGVFFIGVPAIIALIFLSQFNHLAIHIVVTIISFLASTELFHIFSLNFNLKNKFLIASLTCSIHLVMLFKALFNFDIVYVDYVYIFTILFVMGKEVFSGDNFADSNARIVSSVTILTYAGFLWTFVSRLTFLAHSKEVLILFLTMVFFCDSLAWFFGVLFGKNNKGFIKASPNKSIAGFCGGFAGSVLSGVVCFLWKGDVFAGSIFKIIFLGLVIGLTSIIGDLVESVLKRSSNCKDSGSLIPGRGGILDSIGSIVFSAPVFYILINLLYPGM